MLAVENFNELNLYTFATKSFAHDFEPEFVTLKWLAVPA